MNAQGFEGVKEPRRGAMNGNERREALLGVGVVAQGNLEHLWARRSLSLPCLGWHSDLVSSTEFCG